MPNITKNDLPLTDVDAVNSALEALEASGIRIIEDAEGLLDVQRPDVAAADLRRLAAVIERHRGNPASSPSKAPAVYTMSGLSGAPDERMRKIGEMTRLLGGHVTIIELPDGATLNRVA